jgi:hypothetical protein
LNSIRRIAAASVTVTLLGAAPEPGGRDAAAGAPGDGAILDTLVTAVRTADYRGDRPELRRLVAALDRVTDPGLAANRRYWQGFALWRRALNGFNETPTPIDLGNDLDEAVRMFRAALAGQPGWIEAEIGIVGCLANLLFLAGDDQVAAGAILAAYVPMFRDLVARGPDNPRALWLIGGSQLGAPPPYGGDAAKAAATFQRGLEASRREALGNPGRPAHVPSWGGAENLMSLAYLHSHSALEDRELALAYARATLVLVPQWHYVAEILLPQIEALGPRAKGSGGGV